MKILLVSYYFDEDASGIISGRVARELSRQGIDVHVITSSKFKINRGDAFVVHTVPDWLSDNNILIRIWNRLLRTLKIGRFPHHKLWRGRTVKYIKKLLSNESFDWLYCRSTPFDANYVGFMVGRECKIKVLQHFTDPFPPEGDFMPKYVSKDSLIRDAEKIIHSANLVSFGNGAMLEYERTIIAYDFVKKTFISNDIASSEEVFFAPTNNCECVNLVYLGNIYYPRNPIPLIEAIKHYKSVSIVLNLYSNKPMVDFLSEPFISYQGRTDDVIKALIDADVLIDIDGDSDFPVYISSKLKDYLLVNRPILSITPKNSPSSQILSGLRTVRVVQNNVTEIIDALEYLMKESFTDDDYSERESVLKMFSPRTVVETIVNNMSAYKLNIN